VDEAVETTGIAAAVAQAVRELRHAEGLTLEDLADRTGLHRTHIGLVERGERSLTLNSAARLAAAFGMSLSDLVAHAERAQDAAGRGSSAAVQSAVIVPRARKRLVDPTHLEQEDALRRLTGLGGDAIVAAIESTYLTLDMIDDELSERSSPPISGLVELANLSSMIGNLLCAGVDASSAGAYKRNRPHHFPDLVPQFDSLPELEVKTALETNRPKGHLPKPGTYLTFRYVLADRAGVYRRGKDNRGDTAWVWEVRVGVLSESDFDLSNTPGDSGKTAVINNDAFLRMERVFYASELFPYARRTGRFGDHTHVPHTRGPARQEPLGQGRLL
jgi:transcriptional regulator with XRE-family HTH domain